MIIKVLYDFRRPCWTAYGRVLFLDVPDEVDTQQVGRLAAQWAEPDAEIIRVDVSPSTHEIREAFERRRRAAQQWQANVSRGIPNPRRLL